MLFTNFIKRYKNKASSQSDFVKSTLQNPDFPKTDDKKPLTEQYDAIIQYLKNHNASNNIYDAFEACWKDYVRHEKSLKTYKPVIGDRVRLNNKYYVSEKDKDKVFTVLSNPYDLCGTKVVKITDKGPYAYDGLTAVPA